MIINFKKYMHGVGLVLVLSSCGGGGSPVPKSDSGSSSVAINSADVFGVWQNTTNTAPGYEFFGSAVEAPYIENLKTGRIVKDNDIETLFYWDISADGIIQVNQVGINCPARPLTLCPVVAIDRIQAEGGSVNATRWHIKKDKDANGSVDESITENYQKLPISIINWPKTIFYLYEKQNIAFGLPMSIWVEGDYVYVDIRDDRDLDDGSDFEKRIIFSGRNIISETGHIELKPVKENSYKISKEFSVASLGYRTLEYTQHYDKARLAVSNFGDYVLSYQVNRDLILPTGIAYKDVALDETFKQTNKSIQMKAINNFITGPKILPGDIYYGAFRLDVNAIEKSVGEIQFLSETSGKFRIASVTNTARNEVRNFTWIQEANGKIRLEVSGYGSVTLDFVAKIEGGYQALFTARKSDGSLDYRLTDFVADAKPQVSNFSGRYRVTGTVPNFQNPSTYDFEVDFAANGELNGFLRGYWFVDELNRVVSYECYDSITKALLRNYSDCFNAFGNLSSIDYGHVRIFNFLQAKDENYLIKYTSDFYSGPNKDAIRDFQSIGLVFRVKNLDE